MKISELNTKSFLGSAGAAANSYVLINYEDNTTNEPVTYKASLDELGKSIANNLHLYKATANGAVTTDVSQGAYVDGTAQQFITSAAITGLASTGYVTSAINTATSDIGTPIVKNNILQYYSDLSSTEYVTVNMINGAASTGYVTSAISGLASTGYVTSAVANAVANAGDGGWIDDSGVAYTDEQENKYYGLVYGEISSRPTLFAMTDSGKPEELKPLGYYNTDGSIMMTPIFINPDDNNLYTVNDSGEISGVNAGGSWVNESGIAYTDEETEATYKGVVYALNDACMPTLYEMTECVPSPIPPIGYFDETNSVKYTPVFLSDEDSGLYTIDEEADITAVPLTVSGSDVAHAVYTSDNDDYRNILYKTESGIPTLYYMTQNSGPIPLRALAFDASQHTYEPIYYRNGETYTADASGSPVEISLTNGLASTGYVTSAINTATSGLASTGYVSSAISSRVRNTMLFIDNSGDFAYEENNIIYPMLSTPPNLDDTKCVVTVSTNGDLYYYDSIHDEYKLISSLQNNA